MELLVNILAVPAGVVIGLYAGLGWYYHYRKGQGMYQKPKASERVEAIAG